MKIVNPPSPPFNKGGLEEFEATFGIESFGFHLNFELWHLTLLIFTKISLEPSESP
jgi:hypothetical protein